MKELRKLSTKYAASTHNERCELQGPLNETAALSEMAFEAGFKKAREMAVVVADNMEMEEFGIQHGSYRKPFLNLGESDVK